MHDERLITDFTQGKCTTNVKQFTILFYGPKL